jgi:hypothetical protein
MQNTTTSQCGPWVLHLQSRPHPVHPALLAAELRYQGREDPIIDLRDGPFAPVACAFGPGPVLRIELATMANPLGGIIRAEIDLERAEWIGGGTNGRQPIASFINRFTNPRTPAGPWPVQPKATPPASPVAPASPTPPPVSFVPAPVEAPLRPASDIASVPEAPTPRPVGLRREMRSKDGVWRFDLEENGRFEITAGGRERPYYNVRVVRLPEGKVVADTRLNGYEGWVIGDEIQLSRPGSREPWIAVDTVYGEFWSENVRGPLSEVQDVANLAREW